MQTQKAGKAPGFKLCLSWPCILWAQSAQIANPKKSYTIPQIDSRKAGGGSCKVLPSQMLHLPQKLSPTSPNNALATKSDTPTWPNIAPGTTPVLLLQYYPAKCCTCHRNCLSNITKQCSCHQKLTLQHDQILLLALLHYYYSSTTPQPKCCTWHRNCLSNITKHCACHEKVTLQHDQIIAPGTTPVLLLQYYPAKCCTCPQKLSPTSPNNALATKSDTPTWPNIAPGTTPVLLLQYYPAKCCTCHRNCLSNITKQCACHQKLTLQHDQILLLALLHYYYSSTTQPNAAPATEIVSNITKQCACHEKWHSNMTKYCAWHYSSTTTPVLPSQMLHLPQKLSLQHYQTMRLPPKIDTPTWPNIAPGTTPLLLLQYYPAKCCTCHRNCLSNITKHCACHEKWHSNMTKYCACHEKWHRNSSCGHKRPKIPVTSDQKLRSQATLRPLIEMRCDGTLCTQAPTAITEISLALVRREILPGWKHRVIAWCGSSFCMRHDDASRNDTPQTATTQVMPRHIQVQNQCAATLMFLSRIMGHPRLHHHWWSLLQALPIS